MNPPHRFGFLVCLGIVAICLNAASPSGWAAETNADVLPTSRDEQSLAAPDPGLPVQPSPCLEPAPPSAPSRDPDLREGWPVDLGAPGAGFPYTPTLIDADHDGAAEIFLTGGHTFGLRGDGTFLPGWPTVEMTYMGYGTNGQKPAPSAADLDGDGGVEILWSERDWWAGSSIMWCFNGKNLDGSDLPGFPQQAIDEPSNALDVPFVLGDTDGDGDLEAWGPHTRGNTFEHYRLSGFDHEGTRLFTTDLPNPSENIVSLYFGDLDGNGVKEMFSLSWLNPSFWLHAYTPAGGEQAGYPLLLHSFSSGYLPFGPPVPVDLDGDGDLELLLGHWDGSGSRVFGFHHDGTAVAGFPIAIASSSQLFFFGLGDVTGDRQPELIALDNHLGFGYRVHVLDLGTGAPLPGWPYAVANWPKGFPTVADVDNDGLQDICFTTDGGELYALSGDGQILDGYPKLMVSGSISGAAAGDIDGDGLFELVAATWDGWVYAWDTDGEARLDRADWPMRGVNARNTGVFGDDGGASSVGLDPPAPDRPRLLDRRLALSVEPNPTTGSSTFAFGRTGSPDAVTLEIFDASGRRVAAHRIAYGGPLRWNAGALPSGLYTARARSADSQGSVRLIVVR